jgi:hypothetical protein
MKFKLSHYSNCVNFDIVLCIFGKWLILRVIEYQG